jgi:hypothetical protein
MGVGQGPNWGCSAKEKENLMEGQYCMILLDKTYVRFHFTFGIILCL